MEQQVADIYLDFDTLALKKAKDMESELVEREVCENSIDFYVFPSDIDEKDWKNVDCPFYNMERDGKEYPLLLNA
jgi:hypothetical protein